jgi:hypothetical protein
MAADRKDEKAKGARPKAAKPAKRAARQAREARLAAALRQNLRRRKDQGRARAGETAGKPGDGPAEDGDDRG